MYTTVLFDLDGTLTDPGLGITNSVMYALRKYGIDVPPSDRASLYPFIGPPLTESFSKYFGFSAEQAVEAQKAEAVRQAAEQRRAADMEAAALRDKLHREAEAEAEKQYARLLESAETESRKQLLTRKQALVDEAFRLAVEKLCQLDDGAYTTLLARLAAAASETGQEEIILNERDRTRCGKAVVREANRLCGGSLRLSAQCRAIPGGLILSRGKIEVNCALDTLAALRRSSLAAEAARRLFA